LEAVRSGVAENPHPVAVVERELGVKESIERGATASYLGDIQIHALGLEPELLRRNRTDWPDLFRRDTGAVLKERVRPVLGTHEQNDLRFSCAISPLYVFCFQAFYKGLC